MFCMYCTSNMHIDVMQRTLHVERRWLQNTSVDIAARRLPSVFSSSTIPSLPVRRFATGQLSALGHPGCISKRHGLEKEEEKKKKRSRVSESKPLGHLFFFVNNVAPLHNCRQPQLV